MGGCMLGSAAFPLLERHVASLALISAPFPGGLSPLRRFGTDYLAPVVRGVGHLPAKLLGFSSDEGKGKRGAATLYFTFQLSISIFAGGNKTKTVAYFYRGWRAIDEVRIYRATVASITCIASRVANLRAPPRSTA